MSALPMHAFHPPMVHLPLIAFAVAVLLDGLDAFSPSPRMRAAATVVWWLAMLGAAGAVTTGLIAYSRVDHSEAGHAAMTLHRNLALASVAVLLASALTRWRMRRPKVAFALGTVGVVGLVAVGYLGGELVFRHGIGISTVELTRIQHERGAEDEVHVHEHPMMREGTAHDTMPAHEHSSPASSAH